MFRNGVYTVENKMLFLSTIKCRVTEKELAEKTVRLAELNRQLEHDDKGRGKDNDPSTVMEDTVAEPVKSGQTEIRKESVKEKLAEYKAQAAAINSAGVKKATGREAVL